MRKIIIASLSILTLFFLTACRSYEPRPRIDIDSLSHNELMLRAMDLGEHRTITMSGDIFPLTCIDVLASWSDDIVRVEVLDERVEVLNISLIPEEMFWIHTINRLRVLEVFKGDTEIGDIIEVAQPGGRLGYVEAISSFTVPLTVGDELVLFLINHNIEFDVDLPRFLTATGLQSIFQFPALSGESIGAFSSDQEIMAGNEMGTMTLTVGDLMRFAAEHR